MLTEKDYCDYDTCVALKELGYNGTAGECSHFGTFYMNGKEIFYDRLYNSELKEDECLRVPLYLAQKWLREEKKMSINITNVTDGTFFYSILRYSNGHWQEIHMSFFHDGKIDERGKYLYYEEALFEGIKTAIKILKK